MQCALWRGGAVRDGGNAEAGKSLRSKTLSPGGGPVWQPVGQALPLDVLFGVPSAVIMDSGAS